jgi:hypothetical protein
MEQCEKDLLRHTIRIIYSAKEGCYVPVKELNLAKHPQHAIFAYDFYFAFRRDR